MAVMIAAFVIGLLVGSFLNVCIWRLPREESVVRGRSRCPACGRTIPWYDNIPLLSFAWLGRRCRFCRAPISWRYPVVELLTGVVFAAVAARWGMTGPGLVYAAWLAALIVVSVIDAREQIIPDIITVPGTGLAVLASACWPSLHGTSSPVAALVSSLHGALLGAGAIALMGMVGEFVFRKEAMGQGDVKLMALLGAILGGPRVLLAFFLAPILGSIVGLPLRILRKQELIPYGPFLSVAAVIALWWGEALLASYWQSWGGF